jgi:transcriptional regulator with XRE-family HTH domain
VIVIDNDRDLGQLIRQLRHEAGLSLTQLGARCHITKGGMGNRETKPRAMTAGALIESVRALGYDVVLVPRSPVTAKRAAHQPRLAPGETP